jgi:hypothetical protein
VILRSWTLTEAVETRPGRTADSIRRKRLRLPRVRAAEWDGVGSVGMITEVGRRMGQAQALGATVRVKAN